MRQGAGRVWYPLCPRWGACGTSITPELAEFIRAQVSVFVASAGPGAQRCRYPHPIVKSSTPEFPGDANGASA